MNPSSSPSKRGAATYVGIGVVFLILALAFLIADAHAINAAYRFYVLSQRGRPVVGIVEGLRVEPAGASGARCPRHHVMFVYIARVEKRIENHIVHGDIVVGESTYRSMHMGEVLPVIYDPVRPKTHLINFANRIRTDNPFQVWLRANDRGGCPTGGSASHG